MARFTNAEWGGHKLKVWPTGIRRYTPYKILTLPYNVSTKAKFVIEISEQAMHIASQVYLSDLPLQVKRSDEDNPYRFSHLDSLTKAKSANFEVDVPPSGSVEVYIGERKKTGAGTLVFAEAYNPVVLVSILINGVLLAAILLLLGLK